MKKTPYWLAGVLGVGAALAFFLGRKKKTLLPTRAWQPLLEATHGKAGARQLMASAEERARRLMVETPLPEVRPLRMHLIEYILPGLAIYKTLLEAHAGDRQAALAETEPLFKAWTVEIYGGLMAAFRFLPAHFFFFRWALKLRFKNFPASAWKTEWLENNARRVAFNNRTCYYLVTLSAYGAPELTPLFCRIDEWMAEMLPPDVVFQRTQTLANGGELCDFCYAKKG